MPLSRYGRKGSPTTMLAVGSSGRLGYLLKPSLDDPAMTDNLWTLSNTKLDSRLKRRIIDLWVINASESSDKTAARFYKLWR
jgi:hypothetical protein